MIQVTRRGRPHHGERQEGKPGCTSSRISDDKSVHAREVREVRDAKNNEAHGAMDKEHHVRARRRVGEPAVSL